MTVRRLIVAIPSAIAAAAITGGIVVTFIGLYSQDLHPGSAGVQLARLAMVFGLSILLSPLSAVVGALPASIGLFVGAPVHILLSRCRLTHIGWYVLAGVLAGLFVGLLLPVFRIASLIAGAVGGATFHRVGRVGRA